MFNIFKKKQPENKQLKKIEPLKGYLSWEFNFTPDLTDLYYLWFKRQYGRSKEEDLEITKLKKEEREQVIKLTKKGS